LRANLLICVVAAILSQGLEAQVHFPLHKGDLWQFASNYPDSVFPEIRVLGDTTLPNSLQYARCQSRFLGRPYMRQVGSAVYSFNISTGQDFKLFDFTLGPADTVSTRTQFGGQFAITVVDTGRISASQGYWKPFDGKRSWIFDDNVILGPSSGYSFARYWVIDSIGIVYVEGEPGYVWTLTGARIDGQVRFGVMVSVGPEAPTLARGLHLAQNFPNPFNPETTIPFELDVSQEIDLTVFDITGSQVARLISDRLAAGSHIVTWNGSSLAAGTYFCRLKGETGTMVRRMLLLK
jgi:hypothetical protein